jgi:Tfp pilus assembly PilM family ATPase/Tfp pilus assembly protein PilN
MERSITIMKIKHAKVTKYRGATFVVEILQEGFVKGVVLSRDNQRVVIGDAHVVSVSANPSVEAVTQALQTLAKRFSLKNDTLTVSVPRSLATTRIVRFPAFSHSEIENMATLHAPRFLPYAAEDLITGFEVLETKPAEYSLVQLVMVPRATVERYLAAFHACGLEPSSVSLSSYGLLNWYLSLPANTGAAAKEVVCIIEVDAFYTEIAVLSAGTLLLSRSFRLMPVDNLWQTKFIKELKDTLLILAKEFQGVKPQRFVLTGLPQRLGVLREAVRSEFEHDPEVIAAFERFKVSRETLRTEETESPVSFTHIAGLAMRGLTRDLNLLPASLKGKRQALLRRQQRMTVISYGFLAAFACSMVFVKLFFDRQEHLQRLKAAYSAIQIEVDAMEKVKNKVVTYAKEFSEKTDALSVLKELYALTPSGISLSKVTYRDAKEVILKGYANDMANVSAFVSALEKSAYFQNVKLKQLSERKSRQGQTSDFEIVCPLTSE